MLGHLSSISFFSVKFCAKEERVLDFEPMRMGI